MTHGQAVVGVVLLILLLAGCGLGFDYHDWRMAGALLVLGVLAAVAISLGNRRRRRDP